MLDLLNPYDLEEIDNGYQFTTESGVLYFITFIKYLAVSDFLETEVYMFNIERADVCSSSHANTERVRDTVIFVLTTFFEKYSDALLTVYDILDGKQACRKRLFDRWFDMYHQGKIEKDESVFMIGEEKTFASLLFASDHKNKENLKAEFKALVNINFYC